MVTTRSRMGVLLLGTALCVSTVAACVEVEPESVERTRSSMLEGEESFIIPLTMSKADWERLALDVIVNLYPIDSGVAGNFGTVNVGDPSNSTADLVYQILYGLEGGYRLELPADLSGDTGVSAGIGSALEQIIGEVRLILLFDNFQGQGGNAVYHVVGLGAVQIVDVHWTGSMGTRSVSVRKAPFPI